MSFATFFTLYVLSVCIIMATPVAFVSIRKRRDMALRDKEYREAAIAHAETTRIINMIDRKDPSLVWKEIKFEEVIIRGDLLSEPLKLKTLESEEKRYSEIYLAVLGPMDMAENGHVGRSTDDNWMLGKIFALRPNNPAAVQT